ncbi:MAG: 30S ribosomal protein S3 [Candidatus Altiarchaeales archaeon]|nr:30S ribosomal protein S3 [Candidatus Altiarchaeales archaeon]MBD3416340.1 30S ribosomal protein S3 [Candidatus Altiarchaeales archaeon]
MAIERHFIQEGVIRSEIESFLRNELNRAGYSGITIQKTPLTTRVVLYVEKPPIVIGKKGSRINSLTNMLKEKFGVDNPSIDVQKIEKPTLDPNIIARRIAVALERGMNRRRIAYKAVRAVMSSKARGVEIILSGKIVGKGGRSRNEKYSEGYMKKAGDSLKLVRIGSTQAYLKAGVIGVTVKIVPPDTKFPDHINVLKGVKEEEIEGEDTKKKAKKKTKKKAKKAKKTAEKKDDPGEDKEETGASKADDGSEKAEKEESNA